ncbi:hypothetical protein AQJ66_05385 [Streptomyces bungoensis]|uniref:Uncharacterized protein n=1 Tax=Streptomyces bungoensis TaxID=285568 RepID=A0A101TAU8_9ACTN|nr:hypothetical protein [Streptomyces bungoensis]KUN88902.1 hypothetical protein AQJ66_05385 [Streptomyces bungoensis]
MSQVKAGSPDLRQPLQTLGSALSRLPGAEQMGKATDSALDWIGTVSPRGRRMAVYAGAGVLGLAGVVEWPLALTGAAVAWLTQPRPRQDARDETAQNDGVRSPQGDAAVTGARAAVADRGPAPSAGTDTQHYGPGDRLAPFPLHHDHPEHHTHEQPAKVGDPVTASALKKVAKASEHHT